MEMMKWRSRSKVVAYVDLVLTSITLLFITLMAVGTGVITSQADNLEFLNKFMKNEGAQMDGESVAATRDILTKNAGIVWTVLAIFGVFTLIQLLAAVILLYATDMGKESCKAMRMSGFWNVITVISLIIQCCFALLSLSFIIFTIALVIRGLSLYTVCKFRDELRDQQVNEKVDIR